MQTPWLKEPAFWPAPRRVKNPPRTHPVGLVLLMEGVEGLRSLKTSKYWWKRRAHRRAGVGAEVVSAAEPGDRVVLPVRGSNCCSDGGSEDTLDVAHMSERAALEALDRYEGAIIASHANARALLKAPAMSATFSDLHSSPWLSAAG